MHAGVAPEVDGGHGGGGHAAHGVGPGEGQDGAVVVLVAVHVEHVRATGRDDAIEGGAAPTLADVHCADQHR
jgi:hypothetical protein